MRNAGRRDWIGTGEGGASRTVDPFGPGETSIPWEKEAGMK
jgi:hypothetical protein